MRFNIKVKMAGATRLLGVLCIVAAVFIVSLAGLAFESDRVLAYFKPAITQHLANELGGDTSFDKASVRWFWGATRVSLSNMTIKGKTYTFQCASLTLTLDWWRSLVNWGWWVRKAEMAHAKVDFKRLKKLKLRFSTNLKDVDLTKLKGRFSETSFDYSDNWPALHQLAGQFYISPKALFITAHQGTVSGGAISALRAKLDLSSSPQLSIQSKTNCTLQKGRAFLLHSPLKETVGKPFKTLQLHGPMTLRLNLGIPIVQSKPIRVSGTVDTHDALVKATQWPFKLTALQGVIQFDRHHLSTEHLNALFLGQKAQLALSSYNDNAKSPVYQLNIKSQVSSNTLNTLGFNHLAAEGQFNYTAMLRLMPNLKNRSDLDVYTDLKGMALDLPFLSKKKSERRLPMTLHASAQAGQLKGMRLEGEHGAINWERASEPNKATGRSSSLISLLRSKLSPSFINKTKHLKANLNDLTFFGRSIEHLTFNCQPHRALCQLALKGRGLEGQARWNDAKQRIEGRFGQLKLRPEGLSKRPNIAFLKYVKSNWAIDHLTYGDHVFNHVKLTAFPSNDSLKIKALSAKTHHMNLKANGMLADDSKGQSSEMKAVLRSSHVGALLKEWGMSDSIKRGTGVIHLDLNWPGRLLNLSKQTIEGTVRFDIKNGSIVDVGRMQYPINLGRVLTLFNWQNFARRLRLDFRDVASSGFQFDRLSGKLNLNNSKAQVETVDLKGPMANIHGKGSVDIAKRRYNLALTLMPHVDGTVPLVTAFIWNPFAGMVAWAADALFRKPISQLTSVHYRLKGQWNKPTIHHLPDQKR